MRRLVETTVQTAVRLPVSLLKRLDKYAREQREETGTLFTRTDAVRVLLNRALRQVEKKK